MTWGIDTPVYVGDVQNAVIDLLTSMALTLDGAPVEVGPAYPDDATPERPAVPYLGVMDLGASEVRRAYEVATIQVVAWHNNPSPAKDLRSLALGQLVAFRGSDALGAITPATRPAIAQDPDTGLFMAPFTVRVVSLAR